MKVIRVSFLLWSIFTVADAIADQQAQCAFSTVSRATNTILGDATHGDFDGDGDLDLAVISSENDEVLIFFNHGDGSFDAPTGSRIAVDGETIACGDLDGDGDLDLAIGNSFSNFLTVKLNPGNGFFGAGLEFPIISDPTLMTNKLQLADLDNDGDLDIAVTNTSSDPEMEVVGSLSIMFNNGSGSFGAAMTMDVGFNPSGMAAKDIDDDGDLDLYLSTSGATEEASPVLLILENDGAGGLSVTSELETIQAGNAVIQFADVDADNFEDMIVVSGGSNFSIFYGTSEGKFAPETTALFSGLAVDIEWEDLDSDSDLDAILSSGRLDRIGVLLNNGNRTFSHIEFESVGECAGELFRNDFDNDGCSEFVVIVEEGMSVVTAELECQVNSPNCALISKTIANVSDPDAIILADLNGDLVLDIAASVDDPGIAILYGNVDGTFSDPELIVTPPFVSSIAAGDIDGDSDMDLVAENSVDGTVSVYLNNGGGAFNATQEILIFAPGFTFPTDLKLLDLDGDDDLDLIVSVGSLGNGNSFVHLSDNQNGFFVFKSILSLQSYPTIMECVDIDGDMDVDLVLNDIGTFPSAVSIYKNDGNGAFETRLDVSTDGAATSPGETAGSGALAIGDVDGDATLDILVADRASDFVSLLKGRGDGTFDPPVLFELGIYSASLDLELVDVDDDGDLDLLNANGFANNVMLLLNDGEGNFELDFSIHAGLCPNNIFASDYDNDGMVEFFITNGDSNSIIVSSITCTSGLLGDVNLDGQVNLLDIAPFVDRITSGVFQFEADINGDGDVDLLDIAGFVDLLVGQ